MSRFGRLALVIYFLVGVFVAWTHGYIGVGFLRALANAILGVLLWFLVPLGVNLHVH